MSAASGSPRHAVNNLRRVHGASPNASQAKSCNTAHGCFKCGKCDATVSWPCSGKWCFCWMASSVCNHWTFSSKRPGVNITYMYLAVCQRRVCKKATSAAIVFVHKARVGIFSSEHHRSRVDSPHVLHTCESNSSSRMVWLDDTR
jgi:hypothetical protein